MIKLEHVVLASPEQMEFIIEGMRNPLNSWAKSDSKCLGCEIDETLLGEWYKIGPNDHSLMQRLSNAGTDHRKFMRMIPVYVRITAPLYWWKEFDTYKVGTVANSCSTMHKIQAKEFTMDDFSADHLFEWNNNFKCDLVINYHHTPDGYPAGNTPKEILNKVIDILNVAREEWIELDRKIKGKDFGGDESVFSLTQKQKDIWWQMIQLLPSSYNQTRNVMLNYEVLANIYKSRKNHKLDEWRELCKWIETLPYQELITGEDRRCDCVREYEKLEV